MTLHKTVTAQDFIEAIRIIVNRHDGNEYASLDEVLTSEMFDALLSRARQEAAEEMKSKLEEIYSECQRRDNERHKLALLKFGKEARREGRLEGLKEMDIAWKTCVLLGQKDTLELSSYRAEYNQP